MQEKIKHLEFIQTTISRMSQHSFLLKGWSITIAGALVATTIKETNFLYLYTSIFIVSIFWLLDGYFLSKENLFRKLYDKVRVKDNLDIDFSMHTNDLGCLCTWVSQTFSKTLVIFYGGILLAHVLLLTIK